MKLLRADKFDLAVGLRTLVMVQRVAPFPAALTAMFVVEKFDDVRYHANAGIFAALPAGSKRWQAYDVTDDDYILNAYPVEPQYDEEYFLKQAAKSYPRLLEMGDGHAFTEDGTGVWKVEGFRESFKTLDSKKCTLQQYVSAGFHDAVQFFDQDNGSLANVVVADDCKTYESEVGFFRLQDLPIEERILWRPKPPHDPLRDL